MNIFVLFPSPNTASANATIARWHERGYRSAVLIDKGQESPEAEMVIETEYPGYVKATNRLARQCVRKHGADIIIAAADDCDPDPNHTAQEIGERFMERFGGTFGVMQPMGDRFGALAPDAPTPAAVSPWVGREFVLRHGPFHPGYWHYYADAELWHVAQALGVLWAADEFTQYHRHHSRGHADALTVEQRATAQGHGQKDRELFLQRNGLLCGS